MENYKNEKEKRQFTNYPIGTKVIVKTNDNSLYSKGVIVDYIRLSKAKNLFPVIELENGEEVVSMGIIRHDIESRNIALDKLNGIEQWNVLSEFYTIEQ